MVRTVADITEFAHLVRRDVIDEDTLTAVDTVVSNFHVHRESFRLVCPDGFSLPRQHSMVHYRPLIQMFGAPNGLCSSITESKHIKAVKKPYRRSNRNKPLSQILLTNQRLDKLGAARVDFTSRGMMSGALFPLPAPPLREFATPPPDSNDENVDHGAVDGPTCLGEVRLAQRYGARLNRIYFILCQSFSCSPERSSKRAPARRIYRAATSLRTHSPFPLRTAQS